MRELIALRAKIDLILSDTEDQIGDANFAYENNGDHFIGDCCYGDGFRDGLKKVTKMIDEMVGARLEEMYAEHIQEEAKADKH